MPRKQPVRLGRPLPDYGIPNSIIKQDSWAEKILMYAVFIEKIRPQSSFSFKDYKAFRMDNTIRRDVFNDAINRLVRLSYMRRLTDDQVQVTAKGIDAQKRIAMRNAATRPLRDDDEL